ncbi:hypothetical protein ACRAWD_32115 [Caulobacter segnis]
MQQPDRRSVSRRARRHRRAHHRRRVQASASACTSERQLQAAGGGVARGTVREALFAPRSRGGHLPQGPQRPVRLAAAGHRLRPDPLAGPMSYVEAQGTFAPETETPSKVEIVADGNVGSDLFSRPVGAPMYWIRLPAPDRRSGRADREHRRRRRPRAGPDRA